MTREALDAYIAAANAAYWAAHGVPQLCGGTVVVFGVEVGPCLEDAGHAGACNASTTKDTA